MQSTFLLEEPPARVSAWQDFAKALLTHAGTSCLHTAQLLNDIGPSGSSGRTSPAFCPATGEEILAPSSGSWASAGLGSPTEFLTLSLSEWTGLDGLSLKDEGVSSLSDILETGDLPQRFYLSPKACRGILRRAEKRGKDLPEQLRKALQSVAFAPEQEEP